MAVSGLIFELLTLHHPQAADDEDKPKKKAAASKKKTEDKVSLHSPFATFTTPFYNG